jgi:FKBP-type peptidyl-prolyl cis-trans isomerase (trigger factor)
MVKKFRQEKEKIGNTKMPTPDEMQQSIMALKSAMGVDMMDNRLNAANEFINKTALKVSTVIELLIKAGTFTREEFESAEATITEEFYGQLEKALDEQAGYETVERPADYGDMVVIKSSMKIGEQTAMEDRVHSFHIMKNEKHPEQMSEAMVGMSVGESKDIILKSVGEGDQTIPERTLNVTILKIKGKKAQPETH